MNIVWTRRITQIVFLAVFLWFCLAGNPDSMGSESAQYPINLFFHGDPLVAISVWLASGTLSRAFVWALGVAALTVVLGRFFCGWVCPLGTLQQVTGWLARCRQKDARRILANRYRSIQSFKYLILAALLASAFSAAATRWFGIRGMLETLSQAGSNLVGLLDPLSLVHRAANLALVPLIQHATSWPPGTPRFFVQAAWIGGLLLAVLALCLWIPRFYCRYICPLGALYGMLARWSFWRIGKNNAQCSMCMRCERDCEGACTPSEIMRPAECVLCFNCLHICSDDVIRYALCFPQKTHTDQLDVSRRGLLVSLVAGGLAVPLARLNRFLGTNFNPRLIRPPGALAEPEFLARCIQCGQCMRVCPTNIIQPAALEAGLDGLWTPVLNYRIGTSGCVPTCLACGQACPTGAIRALSINERLGQGEFESQGPVRMGLAFVERGRCLPWAMGRPCIVCQEVCPVSPKAIYLQETFQPIRFGALRILDGDELTLKTDTSRFKPGALAVGDVFVRTEFDPKPRRIVANSESEITIASVQPFSQPPPAGSRAELLVHLQQPVVDPRYCIGCGVCEHHCPISGLKAIRVTCENETRHSARRVLVHEPTEGDDT